MLELIHLTKSFGGVRATNDLTASFTAGSLSAIIGPNGAGKTTLFNLITGMLKPDAGRIVLDGDDIAGLPTRRIVRRGIGRAFQVASIFSELTVIQSLEGAVLAHRRKLGDFWRPFSQPSSASRAQELLEMLGMQGRADTLSGHLSHGDQKLLDIALALAMEPRVLLLDEPTAGMGPEERHPMIERIHQLWERTGMTVIFIEHDMDIVFAHAQFIHVLYYGSLLAHGTPEEIRSNPKVIDAYLGTGFTDEEAA